MPETTAKIETASRRRRPLTQKVGAEVFVLPLPIVNVYFVQGPAGWVLVDAGLTGTASHIRRAAAERFGGGTRPLAIVLTHGHFDHVGALEPLLNAWEVPVYAHRLELPFLTGKADYPPPDPSVGGGLMAELSFLYPRTALDLGGRVRALEVDGTVPGLPDWRWIHTPGHSPGHVSLFDEGDRLLIAGDAFVTTRQESAYAALSKPQEVNGPPAYFTPDWVSARASVEALALLEPETAATGHGRPMKGVPLREGLARLVEEWDRLAQPPRGRYVAQPAVSNEEGIVYLPPPLEDSPQPGLLGGLRRIAVRTAAAVRRISDSGV
ncbi:MAG: MBL fold metallo-hydrolase [Meiothermus sp.]|nr:MBL fold metallo-hydrolase [Meiothermus sp.]